MPRTYITKFDVKTETFEVDVQDYFDRYWKYMKENDIARCFYFIETYTTDHFLILILHDHDSLNRKSG